MLFGSAHAQQVLFLGPCVEPSGVLIRQQTGKIFSWDDSVFSSSFGGTMDLPAHFRMSLISHFDSPLPSNLTPPVSGLPGGLFQTDVTGDGTGDGTFGSNGGAGDLLPGTNIGDFGRSFGFNGLNQKITNYNNNMVGQATPAGQVLINNGLFTLSQLQTLGLAGRQLAASPDCRWPRRARSARRGLRPSI
jgi:hypothetical protein